MTSSKEFSSSFACQHPSLLATMQLPSVDKRQQRSENQKIFLLAPLPLPLLSAGGGVQKSKSTCCSGRVLGTLQVTKKPAQWFQNPHIVNSHTNIPPFLLVFGKHGYNLLVEFKASLISKYWLSLRYKYQIDHTSVSHLVTKNNNYL